MTLISCWFNPFEHNYIITNSKAKKEKRKLFFFLGQVSIFEDKRLIKFISDFHKKNKVIACICSGAQLLISAKIVKGKKIAGYYSMEDDITNAGAIYTDEPAVVDDKIITTAHYKDMGPWMKSVISFFNEEK